MYAISPIYFFLSPLKINIASSQDFKFLFEVNGYKETSLRTPEVEITQTEPNN